jgi:hypothetical protein
VLTNSISMFRSVVRTKLFSSLTIEGLDRVLLSVNFTVVMTVTLLPVPL